MTRRPRIARFLERFGRVCFDRDLPIDWDALEAHMEHVASLD